MKNRKKHLTVLLSACIFAIGTAMCCTAESVSLTASAGDEQKEAELIELTNQARAAQGLPALTESDAMNQAADVRLQEIMTNFSHLRPNGDLGYLVLKDFQVNFIHASENFASDFSTASDAMSAFMGSADHQARILDVSANCIGVSAGEKDGIVYWVQLFAETPDVPEPVQTETTATTETTSTTTAMTTSTSFATPEPTTTTRQTTSTPPPSTEMPITTSTSTTQTSTTVPPEIPVEIDWGNVNEDTNINANDAALVLTDSAQLGAGNNGILSEAQRKAADLNQDNQANSADAAMILKYAAYAGSGGTSTIRVYFQLP